MGRSLVERAIRRFGAERVFDMLDGDMRNALPWVWRLWARPEQLAPKGNWRWWAIIAGRGFGKTRSGAEWVREKVAAMPGSRGAIIGQTPEEARQIQIEGPAGILAVTPPAQRPKWEPSKGILTWPNGTVAEVFSGADPGSFRGPQFHWLWADELAKWPRAKESFENFNFGLRLEYRGGAQPQGCITTTPRPIVTIKRLLANPLAVVTRGSTYENRANLASSFFDEMRGQYEGTRLGRQELHGEVLDDTPGALWTRSTLDREGGRVSLEPSAFDLIAIGIDPAASNTESSDETGIVAAGLRFGKDDLKLFHVLADWSMYGTPMERAARAIELFQQVGANRFVVETNNGGDWIPALLTAQWEKLGVAGLPPIEVVTATRGKKTRAEPIAALYEQHRVTHQPGLEVLEDQLVTWSPLLVGQSPDRMDALVWALTWLSEAKRLVLT